MCGEISSFYVSILKMHLQIMDTHGTQQFVPCRCCPLSGSYFVYIIKSFDERFIFSVPYQKSTVLVLLSTTGVAKCSGAKCFLPRHRSAEAQCWSMEATMCTYVRVRGTIRRVAMGVYGQR